MLAFQAFDFPSCVCCWGPGPWGLSFACLSKEDMPVSVQYFNVIVISNTVCNLLTTVLVHFMVKFKYILITIYNFILFKYYRTSILASY